MTGPHPTSALQRLARAAHVAVDYEAFGSSHRPPDSTLRAVLSAMGHDCGDERSAARALRALRRRPWNRQIDPVAVVWDRTRGRVAPAGGPVYITLSAPYGVVPTLSLTLEDGSRPPVPDIQWGGRCAGTPDADGRARQRGTVALPDDLPLGYHDLHIDDGDARSSCTVVVAPGHVRSLGDIRRWGWMLQLYAVRSAASWGQGEYPDLGALAAWGASHDADFVLINPVHAAAPSMPRQPSPYSPTSRRFFDPCYLHVPDIDGFASISPDERARLSALPSELAPDAPRIDRDAIWTTKRAALWTLFARDDHTARAELATFRSERGTSLQRFATFCGIAERRGMPFQRWPRQLQDPREAAVQRWAQDNDELVAFHAWLQLQCTRQLQRAQRRATDAGMAIGVIHDLAVGVEAGGADVWGLPDEFARSMDVGAPPDAFNQQGQNWGQPPPLPDAMRARGYRTQREILAAALSTGGGLRIDHILGLSRLFWIPDGAEPAAGTYVGYRAAEQFALLALEAHRADAIVVGEDLGTVDDRVRRLMRHRGVAGSAVLYFETDDGRRRPADRYPTDALASATTHDLPTATGWWDGWALEVRRELGLLTQTYEAAAADVADDQATLLALLSSSGALDAEDPTIRERVVAMYRFLAATPSILVAVALWDAVGDPRQPNVPGTVDAYPNWRLPLSAPTADGPTPITVEQLGNLSTVAQMIAAVARGGGGPSRDQSASAAHSSSSS